MSTETDLARLTAGLDRDAEIAQAACDSARADTMGDAGDWFVDEQDGRGSAGVTSGFPQRVVGRSGDANGVVVYDEGYPHVEQARHIATFDPKRVLRQVEAHRRILARHAPIEQPTGYAIGGFIGPYCGGCGSKGNGYGFTAWPCPDVQDLAAIYTAEEPTDG